MQDTLSIVTYINKNGVFKNIFGEERGEIVLQAGKGK
jgi:hypothetical protein